MTSKTQIQNGEEHNYINVDVEAILSPTFILIDPSVIESVVCSREPPNGGETDTTVLAVGHGVHVRIVRDRSRVALAVGGTTSSSSVVTLLNNFHIPFTRTHFNFQVEHFIMNR
jgi:hypothetical protein